MWAGEEGGLRGWQRYNKNGWTGIGMIGHVVRVSQEGGNDMIKMAGHR